MRRTRCGHRSCQPFSIQTKSAAISCCFAHTVRSPYLSCPIFCDECIIIQFCYSRRTCGQHLPKLTCLILTILPPLNNRCKPDQPLTLLIPDRRFAVATCSQFETNHIQGTSALSYPPRLRMTPSLSIPRTRMGGLFCRVPLPYTVPAVLALVGMIGCGVAIKASCSSRRRNGASERWTMLFVLDGVAQRRRMGVR